MTFLPLSDHPSYQLGAGFYRAIQNENVRRYRKELLDKTKKEKDNA